MAVSQNQRLRKAAAKAARRKAVAAEKLGAQRRELAISKPRHVDPAVSPLADCLVAKPLEGEGRVVLSRKLSLGRYAVVSIDLDFWCMGLRKTFFDIVEGDDYPDFLADLQRDMPMEAADPAYAKKMVRDALAYGRANGFPAPADFADWDRLFGEEVADAAFVFGDEGRPHFVIHPDDPPRYERYVLATLEAKFGPDGYFVTYPLEGDEGED